MDFKFEKNYSSVSRPKELKFFSGRIQNKDFWLMKLNKIIFPAPKPSYTLDGFNFLPIPRIPIPQIVNDLLYHKREIYEGNLNIH